jgi:hypothetical protein
MTANGPDDSHPAAVAGVNCGWNWIVKVPLPSSQVKYLRMVLAPKRAPPPPPMNSSTNVPDGHSGSDAVKVPERRPPVLREGDVRHDRRSLRMRRRCSRERSARENGQQEQSASGHRPTSLAVAAAERH